MNTKKINIILAFSFVISLLFFTACRLDETNPGIVTLEYTSLEEFFEARGAKLQTFEENASNDINITGAEGTVIQIAASDIVNQDGQNPTGNIKVELKEIYSKSQMVISNKPTSSQGEVLESGGEIFLQLKQSDGTELSLKNGATALAKMPFTEGITNPDEMNVFLGIEDGGFSWIPSSSPNNTVEFDSVEQEFSMFMDRFGWINCDYFYSSPDPKTTVKVVPTVSSGKLVDVGAFIVFSDINSVIGMNYSNSNKEFTKANIPTNHKVNIVLIGISEESFYFAKEEVTISNNLDLTINLDLILESDLINRLNSLN